jgi:hypothetical protein
MRRKLGALLVLASFAFAVAARSQNRAAAPLPAAKGANEKSLVAKAQATLGAKQWPESGVEATGLIRAALEIS